MNSVGPGTPLPVRDWLRKSPTWLEILVATVAPDPSLNHLDEGEIQAIALAEEHRAGLVLIDERDGTVAARKRGLTVTGTLGVLDRAAGLGLVDLSVVFSRLQGTTFRAPVRLMERMIVEGAARRRG